MTAQRPRPKIDTETARAAPLATITTCARRFCLDCLGLTSGRGAFDCQSKVCPLYACSPVRRDGRKRVSKQLIRRQCEQCQPEDRSDCGATDCALFFWHPWQPGGQPRARWVTASQRQRLAVIGRSSQFRNPRQ